MIPTSNEEPEKMTQGQFYTIERLIPNYRLNINLEFHSLTFDEANDLINELAVNQKDPVTEKGAYNMTELNLFIKRISGI